MRCVQPHLGLPGHSLIPLILPYKHNANKHPAILSKLSFNPIHTDVSSIKNGHGGGNPYLYPYNYNISSYIFPGGL